MIKLALVGDGTIPVAMDPERMALVAAHARRYADEHCQARLAHYSEQEARTGAGSAALSVAVLAVAHPVEAGDWYGALMARVGHFFRGQATGEDSARFTLEHFARQAPKWVNALTEVADILERSEVDMGEDGRTVRELRACVATLEASRGRTARILPTASVAAP